MVRKRQSPRPRYPSDTPEARAARKAKKPSTAPPARAAASSAPVPSLASLASQPMRGLENTAPPAASAATATEGEQPAPSVAGSGRAFLGRCPWPSCGAEVRDADRHCAKCGRFVRIDLCEKCGAPLDGAKFCARDGTPAINPAAQPPPPPPGAPLVVAGQVVHTWTPKNVAFIVSACNILLARLELDELDDDEERELCEALAPVMNKRLQPFGPWAEEIRLAIVVGGVFFPRAYIKLVIIPEREKKAKEREQAETTAKMHAGPTPAPEEEEEPAA